MQMPPSNETAPPSNVSGDPSCTHPDHLLTLTCPADSTTTVMSHLALTACIFCSVYHYIHKYLIMGETSCRGKSLASHTGYIFTNDEITINVTAPLLLNCPFPLGFLRLVGVVLEYQSVLHDLPYPSVVEWAVGVCVV